MASESPEPNTEETLKILIAKYQQAIDFGLNAQGKPNEFVGDAEKGMQIAKGFQQFQYLQSNPDVAMWVTSANTSCEAIQPLMRNLDQGINSLTATMGTTAASGAAMQIALIRPEDIQKLSSYGVVLREDTRRELDGFLKRFCDQFKDLPDLVRVWKGAWSAFYSASEANLSQAAHSMRDIPSKIISLLAPNIEIEKTEWYQKLKREGKREKPSEEDRLRFLIFGNSEKQDESILRLLTLPLETLNRNYNRLKSVAKGSHTDRAEVESCMIATEDLMIAIFKARNLRTDFSDQKEIGGF